MRTRSSSVPRFGAMRCAAGSVTSVICLRRAPRGIIPVVLKDASHETSHLSLSAYLLTSDRFPIPQVFPGMSTLTVVSASIFFERLCSQGNLYQSVTAGLFKLTAELNFLMRERNEVRSDINVRRQHISCLLFFSPLPVSRCKHRRRSGLHPLGYFGWCLEQRAREISSILGGSYMADWNRNSTG